MLSPCSSVISKGVETGGSGSTTGSANIRDNSHCHSILPSVTSVHYSDDGHVHKPMVDWKDCVEHWETVKQESMDRYAGCCDITEIMLKLVLKTKQSTKFTR